MHRLVAHQLFAACEWASCSLLHAWAHGLKPALAVVQAFMPVGTPTVCADGSNYRPYLAFRCGKLQHTFALCDYASRQATHRQQALTRVHRSSRACRCAAGGSAGQG